MEVPGWKQPQKPTEGVEITHDADGWFVHAWAEEYTLGALSSEAQAQQHARSRAEAFALAEELLTVVQEQLRVEKEKR